MKKKVDLEDEGVPKLLPNIVLYSLAFILLVIAAAGIYFFLELKNSPTRWPLF